MSIFDANGHIIFIGVDTDAMCSNSQAMLLSRGAERCKRSNRRIIVDFPNGLIARLSSIRNNIHDSSGINRAVLTTVNAA